MLLCADWHCVDACGVTVYQIVGAVPRFSPAHFKKQTLYFAALRRRQVDFDFECFSRAVVESAGGREKVGRNLGRNMLPGAPSP